MFDVITVGSSTVDVFASTEYSELIKIKENNKETDLLAYPTGSKILINELAFTTGGGATNTAVALARLGHKVACITKMGSKGNSARVISDLAKEKVNTSLIVRSKGGRTGFSIILDSLEHDRTILAFKGSNNDLRFSEIKKSKLKTKWVYLSTMMKSAYDTIEKISEYAKKNGIKVALNTSSYLAKKGTKFLGKLLKNTDFLILNKDEAEMMLGKGDYLSYIDQLHKLGPGMVVITDGKHGAYASDGKNVYYLKPNKIKVVETTGAGDAFASSFLSGLIKKGGDIPFALKLASANAESVILHHGAKNKLLTYKEALASMRKFPHKITKVR